MADFFLNNKACYLFVNNAATDILSATKFVSEFHVEIPYRARILCDSICCIKHYYTDNYFSFIKCWLLNRISAMYNIFWKIRSYVNAISLESFGT
jgi:hypothetical protein